MMRRAFFALWLPLLLLSAAPATQPDHSQVQTLIDQLGDLQSTVREDATKKLIAMGPSIRTAIIDASKSPDPEVSARAAMILRQFPWDRPGDPAQVRNLLTRYKAVPAQQRSAIVLQLILLPKEQGYDALFRLMHDETDPHVRWSIVQQCRGVWGKKSSPGRDRAKALDTADADPATLCFVAAAMMNDRPADANALVLRAAQAADLSADEDNGELETAIRQAVVSLWERKDFDDVAKLYRVRAQRSNVTMIAGVPEPVCELFALHAKFGPLAGFAKDCDTYSQYLLRPPLLYCHSHLLLQKGFAGASKALDRLALYSGGTDPAAHRETGEFLDGNFWRFPAVNELEAFLSLQPRDDSIQSKTEAANAHLMLSRLHGSADEHGAAATEIEAGLALLDQVPAVLTRNHNGKTLNGEDAKLDLQNEAAGHHLLDALARKDQPEIEKRIKQLQNPPDDDPEVVQEMVAYLTRTGDTAAADKLFAPVETQLRADLDKKGTGQEQNSLAWFLARSGRKLDEAMKLANTAVTNDPTNAAFIDTLAEVYYQTGKPEEAVKLESKALKTEPDRPELESQMRRFKAAMK